MIYDTMYMVLPSEVETLEELDYWYNKFMSLSYYQRKVSNDLSREQFGSDNITRYNKLRSEFLNNLPPEEDCEDTVNSLHNIMQAFEETASDTEITFDLSSKDVMDRVKAAEAEGLIIMVPTNDEGDIELTMSPEDSINSLNSKWEKFNALPANKRVLSSQTAENILGVDNYNLYSREISDYLATMDAQSKEDHPEDDLPNDDIMDKIGPYYNPDEMANHTTSDTMVSESGEIKNKYQWVQKLEYLSTLLECTTNKSKRELLKEEIHSLWWNPEIPFSRETASKTWMRHCENRDFSSVDMRINYLGESKAPSTETIKHTYSYEELNQKIVPIFVCLCSGLTPYGKVIKWFTDSKWSHVSIGFDSALNDMYSFNMYLAEDGLTNGFSREGLRRYRELGFKDMKIKVFALFVTPEQRDAMKESIQWYIDNKDKTSYNFGNILNIALRKTVGAEPHDKDKMICSQFVYSILKLANFRMTKSKNNKSISPADIDELANDARFYCLFEGKITEYKQRVVDKLCKDILISLPLEMFGLEESTKLSKEEQKPKSSIVKEKNIDSIFEMARSMY